MPLRPTGFPSGDNPRAAETHKHSNTVVPTVQNAQHDDHTDSDIILCLSEVSNFNDLIDVTKRRHQREREKLRLRIKKQKAEQKKREADELTVLQNQHLEAEARLKVAVSQCPDEGSPWTPMTPVELSTNAQQSPDFAGLGNTGRRPTNAGRTQPACNASDLLNDPRLMSVPIQRRRVPSSPDIDNLLDRSITDGDVSRSPRSRAYIHSGNGNHNNVDHDVFMHEAATSEQERTPLTTVISGNGAETAENRVDSHAGVDAARAKSSSASRPPCRSDGITYSEVSFLGKPPALNGRVENGNHIARQAKCDDDVEEEEEEEEENDDDDDDEYKEGLSSRCQVRRARKSITNVSSSQYGRTAVAQERAGGQQPSGSRSVIRKQSNTQRQSISHDVQNRGFPATNYKFSRIFITECLGGNRQMVHCIVGASRRAAQIFKIDEYFCFDAELHPHAPQMRGMEGSVLGLGVVGGRQKYVLKVGDEDKYQEDSEVIDDPAAEVPQHIFCKRRTSEFE